MVGAPTTKKSFARVKDSRAELRTTYYRGTLATTVTPPDKGESTVNRSSQEEVRVYAFDNIAGPVYRAEHATAQEAESLARGREQPQVIEILVWPYPEQRDRRPVLRAYYALNLPQAAARAVEIEVRLREQELRAVLSAIRPASAEETELFFMATDALEQGMPEPVSETSLVWSPSCAASDTRRASFLSRASNNLKDLPQSLRTILCGHGFRKNIFGKSERSGPQAANNPMEGGVALKP